MDLRASDTVFHNAKSNNVDSNTNDGTQYHQHQSGMLVGAHPENILRNASWAARQGGALLSDIIAKLTMESMGDQSDQHSLACHRARIPAGKTTAIGQSILQPLIQIRRKSATYIQHKQYGEELPIAIKESI